MFCKGNLDRLLNVYGVGGRRNDARLMGSALAWERWKRERSVGPGSPVLEPEREDTVEW